MIPLGLLTMLYLVVARVHPFHYFWIILATTTGYRQQIMKTWNINNYFTLQVMDLPGSLDSIKEWLEVNIGDQLNRLQTNDDRSICILHHVGEESLTRPVQWNCTLSDRPFQVATKEKQLGNELFRSKCYKEAISSYTNALRNFQVDDAEDVTDCGILFSNRSACFSALGEDKDCLSDIQSALIIGYPEHLRYKLHFRQGKSYQRLGYFTEAKKSFEECTIWQSKALFDDPQKEKEWWNKVSTAISNVSNKENLAILSEDTQIPSILKQVNDQSSVKLSYSEAYGTHMVASDHVPVGEFIMSEKALFSVLDADFLDSHCSHCFRRLRPAQVFCRKCAKIAFCDYRCERKAWEAHHKSECGLTQYLMSPWVGPLGHLVFRIVSSQKKDVMAYLQPRKQQTRSKENRNSKISNKLTDILSLLSHESKRTTEDNMTLSAMALHISRLFLNIISKYDHVDEIACSTFSCDFLRHLLALVLGIIQRVQCNAIEVAETEIKGSIKYCHPVHLGLAIYSNVCRFNHSCDPDVDLCFFGTDVYVFTIKNISPAQQVFVDYGAVFVTEQKNERLQLLKSKYFFECHCHACESNWPLWEGLNSKYPVLLCKGCRNTVNRKVEILPSKLLCSVCKAETNVSEVQSQFADSHTR